MAAYDLAVPSSHRGSVLLHKPLLRVGPGTRGSHKAAVAGICWCVRPRPYLPACPGAPRAMPPPHPSIHQREMRKMAGTHPSSADPRASVYGLPCPGTDPYIHHIAEEQVPDRHGDVYDGGSGR